MTAAADGVALGVIGAGNFGRGVLLPKFKENARVSLRAVTTARGMTAHAVAKQFGFQGCASDSGEILADKAINTVLIATRHNLHGRLVAEALKAGKHVFVEKPLCLTIDELKKIAKCYETSDWSDSFDSLKPIKPIQPIEPIEPTQPSVPLLMVGFNRRFSPYLRKAAEVLQSRSGPLFACYTVNAGLIPKESWIQDPAEGGGRIIGEVCHFADALRFLAGSPVKSVQAMCVQSDDRRQVNRDSVSIVLKYGNGSVGTVLYQALGSADYPKERIEVSAGGATVVIDDFRRMEVFGSKKEALKSSQDKGFRDEVEAFVNCITGKGPVPIPTAEIFETTLVTFAVHESLNKGVIVDLSDFGKANAIEI
jgi:predicted dehydrogenase